MGEKPLTTDEGLVQPTMVGAGPTPLDPMAAAGGINTTRSNIKNSGSMATGAGSSGDAVDGEPIPGIDVKLGKNPGAITGLPPDLQPTPTNPPGPFPDAGPGPGNAADPGESAMASPSGDPADASAGSGIAEAGRPIPGVDIVVKKNH